jgi:asparagine synthase (glutamine-hydrolysing)
MCGIYGHLTTSELSVERAEEGTDFLSHRGPDERGTALRGNVFLGMRRLSIIDLSGGQQPIWNEARLAACLQRGAV